MMRQMAQQLRLLIEQRLAPITPRLCELVNQLEQEADIETAIAAANCDRVPAMRRGARTIVVFRENTVSR
jgi:hypothetical protein